MWKVEPCLGTIGDHPDCDLWPSAMSSPPLALAMICRLEQYFHTFLNKAVVEDAVTCSDSFAVGKASWRGLRRVCWICVSFHSHKSSSLSALNASARYQVPSREPDSDHTGWKDHVTLPAFVFEKLRLLVTRLDGDGAQAGSQLACLSTFIIPHGMLVLSLLLWEVWLM